MSKVSIKHPIPAASGAVISAGRVLLVRRSNPPNADTLALPGGKINLGERPIQATQRELLEETGLVVQPTTLLDVVNVFEHQADGQLARHYLILSYLCEFVSGSAVPQDDAYELMWLTLEEVQASQELSSGVKGVVEKAFAC